MSPIYRKVFKVPYLRNSLAKWFLIPTALALALLLSFANVKGSGEDFSVKEYDDFHRVLHHLQHEALPKNDIATIRGRATELIKLGEAIVKLGVPEGTKADVVSNFKKELETFKKALAKYGADSESGSDTDLKASYIAVHDSFEELAGMLPRK